MREKPLTEETRDLIRQDWRRMRHDADTIRTICQLHAATKEQVLEALGDLYDPAEQGPGRKRGVRTPAELAVLAKVDAGEMTREDAAGELHVEPQTLGKWLKAYRAERAGQAAQAVLAGAACMDPEKMHEPEPADPAEQEGPAFDIESIVKDINENLVMLEGAFYGLRKYNFVGHDATEKCLDGIRLKAEGFIDGLRYGRFHT